MKFESLIDEFYENNKISHNKIIKNPSDGKLTLFKSDLKNPVNGDLSFVSFEELLSKNKLIFKILNNLYYFENFIVIAPKLKVGSTKPSFFLKLYINFDSLKIKENDGFLDKSSQYICDSFESAIIISDSEKKLFKELDVIIRDNLNYFTSKQKKDVLNELETTVPSKTNKSTPKPKKTTPKPKKTTPKPKKSKSDSKSGGCILLILVIVVVSYFVLSPSNVDEDDILYKTFTLGYKNLHFKAGGELYIYQSAPGSYAKGCPAEGLWSIQDDKIIIKIIKSNCTTSNYRDLNGKYTLNEDYLEGNGRSFKN